MIQNYVKEKKKLYNILLEFLKSSEDSSKEFKNLIDHLNFHDEIENRENFKHFLCLVTSISDNYHRENSFFTKIFQILNYYQDQIKRIFSNLEIFRIFKSNKNILLYLFENKIIIIDDNICYNLMNEIETNGNLYCHFFYPEIKDFICEEKREKIKEELLSKDPNIFDYMNEKRKKGENDSYICSLIRQDLIIEFISYINETNIPFTSKINPSLFETNSFLIKNNPTLIEYASFFGSIQIFQYLMRNGVNLGQSLWLYAIHS